MIDEKLKLISNILGNYHKKGNEHLFHCNFCNHHKKKLSVNLLKNKWKCWVCDKKGSSIYILVKTFGTRQQRSEWRSLDDIIDQSDIVLDDMFNDECIIHEPEPFPEEFETLVTKKYNFMAKKPLSYLNERGVNFKDIMYWKMGYCSAGKYSDRVIVPSFDLKGNINYFIARSYKPSRLPYLNPKAPHDFIFNELYLDWEKDVVLVEGVFDAIVAENAIPLLGSTLRENSYVLQQIVSKKKMIYSALDPDAELKESKIIDLLLSYGVRVKKINITPYKDIGEMPKSLFKKRKEQALEITFDNKLEQMLANI